MLFHPRARPQGTTVALPYDIFRLIKGRIHNPHCLTLITSWAKSIEKKICCLARNLEHMLIRQSLEGSCSIVEQLYFEIDSNTAGVDCGRYVNSILRSGRYVNGIFDMYLITSATQHQSEATCT